MAIIPPCFIFYHTESTIITYKHVGGQKATENGGEKGFLQRRLVIFEEKVLVLIELIVMVNEVIFKPKNDDKSKFLDE